MNKYSFFRSENLVTRRFEINGIVNIDQYMQQETVFGLDSELKCNCFDFI